MLVLRHFAPDGSATTRAGPGGVDHRNARVREPAVGGHAHAHHVRGRVERGTSSSASSGVGERQRSPWSRRRGSSGRMTRRQLALGASWPDGCLRTARWRAGEAMGSVTIPRDPLPPSHVRRRRSCAATATLATPSSRSRSSSRRAARRPPLRRQPRRPQSSERGARACRSRAARSPRSRTCSS